jgi:hypothetical protein
VDGHDFGLGEFNIFILTDDPAESFDKARRVVTSQEVPNAMRSGYRHVDDEDYVILWPSSLKKFKVSGSSSILLLHPWTRQVGFHGIPAMSCPLR